MLPIDTYTDRVRCLAFSPDGVMLASGGNRSAVQLWETCMGSEVGRIWTGDRRNNSVAFGPDSRTLATGGHGGVPKLWEISETTPPNYFSHDFETATTFFAGRRLATALDRGILNKLRTLAFDPAGARMLATSAVMEPDSAWPHAGVWDLATGEESASLRTDAHGPCVCDVAPDGRSVVLGIPRATVLLWDLDRARPGMRCDRFAPVPSGIRSWSLDDPALLGPTDGPGEVRAVRFAPDGRSVFATLDNKAVRLGIDDGRPIAVFEGHRTHIRSLDRSPDGSAIVTAGYDRTVRLWDAATGAPLAQHDWEIGKVDCVAYSPDGMTLAAGGEGKIVVWDAPGPA